MPPYLLFTVVLGAIYGAIFHLWRGRNLREFVIYFLTGIIGFGAGQAVAGLLGFSLFMLGPIHLLEASLASWAALFLISWIKPFPRS
jgi:hypothetical protein